jgi:hypothetical protein
MTSPPNNSPKNLAMSQSFRGHVKSHLKTSKDIIVRNWAPETECCTREGAHGRTAVSQTDHIGDFA